MGGAVVERGSVIRPPGFVAALQNRAFVVLYAAEIQSIVGNQLARIALSVLVFERTGSATATAFTYAATFLPAILGGLLLASLGDRFPRRPLMIACDLVRAALFAVMAVPGVPTLGMIGLLVVAVFVSPVFSASQTSYLAGVLEPEIFRVATGLRMVTNQGAQVVGFAVGGVIVEALGSHGALLLNAGTFGLSALVITATLSGRSFAERSDSRRKASTEGKPAAPVTGPELLRRHRIWTPLALASLAGLFVVPEGLAVPFAAGAGAGASETGLLMASIPLGSVLGVVLLVRRVPKVHRRTFAHGMAIGCGIPLVLTGFFPHWPPALALWFLSGAMAAYQVEVMTTVVQSTPAHVRARVVGIANSVLLGAQGLGLIVFGEVTQLLDAAQAIGIAGGLGSLLALVIVGVNARRHSVEDGGRRNDDVVAAAETPADRRGRHAAAESAVESVDTRRRSAPPRHAKPRGPG